MTRLGAMTLPERLRASTEHALDAVDYARKGDCRQAIKWLGVAQKELLNSTHLWPGGLPLRMKPHVVVLEASSDEVVRRCRRSLGDTRKHRRRR